MIRYDLNKGHCYSRANIWRLKIFQKKRLYRNEIIYGAYFLNVEQSSALSIGK